MVLVLVVGIAVTTPVYQANPGMQLFETPEPAARDTDEFGNTDSTAFYVAQFEIEKVLKAPSTAKFCRMSEAKIERDENTWTVTGWVDAENSFGAMLRQEFLIVLTFTGEDVYDVVHFMME